MSSKTITLTNEISTTRLMVLFGATGDLAARKIFPALYTLFEDNALPENFVLIAFARKPKDTNLFCKEIKESLQTHVGHLDEGVWNRFSSSIHYWQSEFDADEGYLALKDFLKSFHTIPHSLERILFYLATPPSYFPLIIEKLSINHLLSDQTSAGPLLHNVMIEKPFGKDLESAHELRNHLENHLSSDQIYLIDHYLGKETVQNITALRFSNTLFESFWHKDAIKAVQIIISEKNGIENRGNFFEASGTLRDIIQNHMLQLLSIVAMEAPQTFSSEDVRKAKLNVVKSLHPLKEKAHVIRGQYAEGIASDGSTIKAYRKENAVSPSSCVETFVTLKTFINTPRWQNVPFYLSSGKCLSERYAEIRLFFKKAPYRGSEFYSNEHSTRECCVITLQPDEKISFHFQSKIPGLNDTCETVSADCDFRDFFEKTIFDAYARLIRDALHSNKHLFVDMEEVMAAWEWLTPVMERWSVSSQDLSFYPAGSNGPVEAQQLLEEIHSL